MSPFILPSLPLQPLESHGNKPWVDHSYIYIYYGDGTDGWTPKNEQLLLLISLEYPGAEVLSIIVVADFHVVVDVLIFLMEMVSSKLV